MYESYWGLERRPFDEGAPGKFLFRSKSFEAALAKLLYIVDGGGDCAMLVGPAGCGKTAIAGILARELAARGRTVARLAAPVAGEAELTSAILSGLDETAARETVPGEPIEQLQSRLEDLLVRRSGEGSSSAIVIDEAQAVSDARSLGRLRMLLNLGEAGSRPVLLFMIARPTAEGIQGMIREFGERLAVRATIEPMEPEESKAYILHRLEAAGSRRGIFTESAAELIAKICGGVPRRINRLCDMCLAAGYAMGADRVGPDVVGEVFADLEGERR